MFQDKNLYRPPIITYTTLSILEEDNCFLIVSLDVVIAMIITKCNDKHLHNKKCVYCGLKTAHFQQYSSSQKHGKSKCWRLQRVNRIVCVIGNS